MAIKSLFALTPEGRNAIGANKAFEIKFDDSTGSVSVELDGLKVVAEQQAAIASVTGTADLTYDQNEVDLINLNKTTINSILTALRAHGIIAT